MRTSVAAMLVIFVSCAVDARGQDYEPSYGRIRAELERGPVASPRIVRAVRHGQVTGDGAESTRRVTWTAAARVKQPQAKSRDSVWNGLLIGAGIGAGGGYLWARNICGSNDAECFAITAPVGVLAGAGIGAAVGALLDALQK